MGNILIYFVLNFIIIFVCCVVSYKFNLVDIPNKRKKHLNSTAYTGGLALSIGYLIALLMFDIVDNDLNLILSIAFLVSVVGLIDDKFQLNISDKISLQIIPIFYLIFFENIKLTTLGNYYYFNLELNYVALPFTLFCVLFLMNAFNYFDGLDGTLSFSTISVMVILYFLTKDHDAKLFLILIFIPLSLFLLFNFKLFNLPKLFLGDSGSLLLGFVISFLLIYFANKNELHPIIIAWSISIFVFEFIAINLIRFKQKKNIFEAGNDHFHHILFKKNNSIFLTNIIIFFLNIFLFLIGYFAYELISSFASLILFVTIFIIYFYLRYRIK